jgi:hypothetical protein
LDEGAGELEIRIRDRAGRVGVRHKVVHDIRRKRSAPEVWNRILVAKKKNDATHARGSSIVGSVGDGRELDEFKKAGSALAEVVFEPLEVGQGIMDAAVEADAALVVVAQCQL